MRVHLHTRSSAAIQWMHAPAGDRVESQNRKKGAESRWISLAFRRRHKNIRLIP